MEGGYSIAALIFSYFFAPSIFFAFVSVMFKLYFILNFNIYGRLHYFRKDLYIIFFFDILFFNELQ